MGIVSGSNRSRWFLLFALLMVSFSSNAEYVFSYASAPGDYIGAGRSAVFTPKDAAFSIYGTAENVTINVRAKSGEFWFVDLSAPRGSRLAPGSFFKVERAAFRSGRSAGLDVSGAGRGCNEVWGEIGIRQIGFDTDGKINSLEASFVQRCEFNNAPELAGVIRYNASQLSLRLDSDEGDYVGGGIKKTYYNDTSIFTVSGNRQYLQYSASGQRDEWTALISAATGKSLRTGTYLTKRFSDATHVGFDFFGNGRGCNAVSGMLRIYALTTDETGKVTRLAADFEQHCEEGNAALKGVIRYGF